MHANHNNMWLASAVVLLGVEVVSAVVAVFENFVVACVSHVDEVDRSVLHFTEVAY